MQRYFLSDGQPDRLKTTIVIGIPIDRYGDYRSARMIDTKNDMFGPHHTRVFGFIFLGWDRAAVRKAVSQHLSKDRWGVYEDESEGPTRRKTLDQKYLLKLSRKTGDVSPIGRYIVESEEIEAGPSCVGIDLVLDIHRTETPGVFKVDFDLGVAEGMMIMCSEKAALDECCARINREDEENRHNTTDEEGLEEEAISDDGISVKYNLKQGNNRGLPSSKRMRKARIHKKGKDQVLRYLLSLGIRETGEGEIWTDKSNGNIKFENDNLASLEGTVDLPIGNGPPFSAWKTSDVPCSSGNKWTDYSEREHEKEWVNRWR